MTEPPPDPPTASDTPPPDPPKTIVIRVRDDQFAHGDEVILFSYYALICVSLICARLGWSDRATRGPGGRGDLRFPRFVARFLRFRVLRLVLVNVGLHGYLRQLRAERTKLTASTVA